ncbi:Sucrase/ferredoxin-like-domain-containing protein [Phycomyces nitens]|nr:Sucrase/ferredoxin-like-domain-containing protein [Phycomyces nitens]
MEWLAKRVASFYSPSCVTTCSTPTCLPPLPVAPLPEIKSAQCAGCDLPCVHPAVPTTLNIDHSRPLRNTVPSYAIHLILMTGKSTWPAHIEDEGMAQALINAINLRKKQKQKPDTPRTDTFRPADATNNQPSERILITNCSLASVHSTQRNSMDILLMPDNVLIANVTPRRANELLDYVLGKPHVFETFPWALDSLVLVCGHGAKDKRCGTIGPMLKQSLEEALDVQGIRTQVALVSHLGGHAFAGNLVIYLHQGQRAIWYGRVTPCLCPDIVQHSMAQDKVIDALVRGVFEAGTTALPQKCLPASLEW